jgi:hypothetical protein
LALLHAHVGRVDDEGLERGRSDHLLEANEAVPELEVLQQRASGGAEEALEAVAQRDPGEPRCGDPAEDGAIAHTAHLDVCAVRLAVDVEDGGAVTREEAVCC